MPQIAIMNPLPLESFSLVQSFRTEKRMGSVISWFTSEYFICGSKLQTSYLDTTFKQCDLFEQTKQLCMTDDVREHRHWPDSTGNHRMLLLLPKKYNPSLDVLSSISVIQILELSDLQGEGEGNGTPLQYSCLENPMDRGACQAAVHGVANSGTRLSDQTFIFHFHALEKEMATHSGILAQRIPGMGEPGGLPSMGSHRVGHD